MERVDCPLPSRSRPDDRVVEVFLHAYKQGRFAKDPRWLPQHEKNVEVIATSITDGRTLAIEHTRVFAFDGHMQQEAILRPIAQRLESIRLPELSGKWVQIFFQPNFVRRLLHRHSVLVQEELVRFLSAKLRRFGHVSTTPIILSFQFHYPMGGIRPSNSTLKSGVI